MDPKRKVRVGTAIVLTCGVVIIASTFMPWTGFNSEGYIVYGSAWEYIELIRDTEHSTLDYLIDRGLGNIIFTGYLFLIVGALLILVSTILFFQHGQSLVTALLFLSFLAAFMSGLNIYSVATFETTASGIDMLVGIGLYVSLAFSILGMAGNFIIYSGAINRTMASEQV